MPEADGAAAAKILVTALERLPNEVTIDDGTPEGPCADIDLGPSGAGLAMARSVVSDGGAMSCYFSGDGRSVDVTVLTDPDRVAQARVAPDAVTHADFGEGARLLVTEANTLDARVNLDGKLVAITVSYGDEVTALRDADIDLVRAVVDAVGSNAQRPIG